MATTSAAEPTRWRLGLPAALLRLEGLTLLGAAVALYAYQGYGWLAFVLLLVAPDLSLIALAVNKRLGAVVYDVAHSLTLPLLLGVVGVWTGQPLWTQVALGWTAHIGMDRALGMPLRSLEV